MKRWVFALALLAGCEPLDLQLFPPRDAGVFAPDENETVDAATPEPPRDAMAAPPEKPEPAPCLDGAVDCEACVALDDCPAGLRCHPFSGECVQPCGSELPECSAPSVCDEELGVCVQCTSSNQCEEEDDDEPICAAPAGVCVECTEDSHCTDDPEDYPTCLTALGGICGCDEDSDCESGYCDLDDNRCDDDDDDDD